LDKTTTLNALLNTASIFFEQKEHSEAISKIKEALQSNGGVEADDALKEYSARNKSQSQKQ
jgi:hypothetical protein